MPSELKNEKGINREGLSSGVRVMNEEESSLRNKSSLEHEMGIYLSQKEPYQHQGLDEIMLT